MCVIYNSLFIYLWDLVAETHLHCTCLDFFRCTSQPSGHSVQSLSTSQAYEMQGKMLHGRSFAGTSSCAVAQAYWSSWPPLMHVTLRTDLPSVPQG